jgi:signal peptidase II
VKFTAPRRLHWLLLISAVVILIDRLTKTWVTLRIPFGGAIPVVPHFLRITHWTNEGAAFSLFANTASPNTVRWGLVCFSSVAALIVLVFIVRLADRITLTTFALALVFAGALGNVHDRIAYGSVVDFIEVHIFGYHWPDFNVADMAYIAGFCLLLFDTRAWKKAATLNSIFSENNQANQQERAL